MRKKVLAGTGVAAVLAGMVLMVSLGVIPALAETPQTNYTAQAVALSASNITTDDNVQGPDTDNMQDEVTNQEQVDQQQPQYAGSILVDTAQYQGVSEADETAALRAKATITSAQAEEVALAANSGTTVLKTGLDNENGVLAYCVELSNGLEVKVDAGSGEILHTEEAGNDANEVAGAEDEADQESTED